MIEKQNYNSFLRCLATLYEHYLPYTTIAKQLSSRPARTFSEQIGFLGGIISHWSLNSIFVCKSKQMNPVAYCTRIFCMFAMRAVVLCAKLCIIFFPYIFTKYLVRRPYPSSINICTPNLFHWRHNTQRYTTLPNNTKGSLCECGCFIILYLTGHVNRFRKHLINFWHLGPAFIAFNSCTNAL